MQPGTAAASCSHQMSDLTHEIHSSHTSAIITHPDADKTTLTEKLPHYGGAIREAGSIEA